MDVLSFEVGPQGAQETAVVLESFLEALTEANASYYRRVPKGPCCPKCAGIRYVAPAELDKLEPGERFLSAERMTVLGKGSCGSLAAMVAGRLRARGEQARVRVELVSDPADPTRRDYHAYVQLGDGTRHDPAAELVEHGMVA